MIKENTALRIFVYGVVQGVGFRPHVARLAEALDLSGSVKNRGGIVEIEAAGPAEAMDDFLHRLRSSPPSGAHITGIETEPLPTAESLGKDGFIIVASDASDPALPLFPPDLPMCPQCQAELYDPLNRRYLYPMISCVVCGPRYSITQTLPYDRCSITMKAYPMCPDCSREYSGNDRRRHAQTISCHECGPQLILDVSGQQLHGNEALQQSIQMLHDGRILAVKNIGGYHFVCLPTAKTSVAQLRKLKGRDKKPFAVMFHRIEEIKAFCKMTDADLELLTSSPRPIVLLEKLSEVPISLCPSVCGDSPYLGAFLPSTPLQDLLTRACGPLIMTSGNLSGSPMIIQDKAMLSFNSPFLAGVLYHTREILMPLDDSVVHMAADRKQVIRRSRGYVPSPLRLSVETPPGHTILAAGSDLKSTFCLMSRELAYLSQSMGDLEDFSVYQSYTNSLDHMRQLFGLNPTAIACDGHPGYLSVKYAHQLSQSLGLPIFPIQHHHAHIASVIAEHHLQGKVLGVAFDGTGYGSDGAVWGGEFLLCENSESIRLAHLRYTPLCGGDASAFDASLAALSYQYDAGMGSSEDDRYPMVCAALSRGIQTERSSSMGRLFDAVSSLLALGHHNSFEAECAIALENAAAHAQMTGMSPHPLNFSLINMANRETGAAAIQADARPVIREIIAARRQGIDPETLALGFHEAVAQMVLAVCSQIRLSASFQHIALSGGVFANQILLRRSLSLLERAGFHVLINQQVPANDGGISLGQAYLCSHLLKRS